MEKDEFDAIRFKAQGRVGSRMSKGRVFEQGGRPCTAGCILGLLLVSKDPVSFGELADRLGVSRRGVAGQFVEEASQARDETRCSSAGRRREHRDHLTTYQPSERADR